MKLLTGFTTATFLSTLTSFTNAIDCPEGIAVPYKFRWKEAYSGRKIATFKVVRPKMDDRVANKVANNEMQQPDYVNNGWTIVIKYDSQVPTGYFTLNHGRYLSTNQDGSMIAFASHEDNRGILDTLVHWFEIAYTFPGNDAPNFMATEIRVIEGEFANMQCLTDSALGAGYTVAGKMVNGRMVAHNDESTDISVQWNGHIPFEYGNWYTRTMYQAEPECANGNSDWQGSCYDVMDSCVSCDVGYDLIGGECVEENNDACNCNSKPNRDADMSAWKECGNGPSCTSCDEVYYVPSTNACPVDEATIGHIWGADCSDMDDTLLTVCDMRPAFSSGTKEIELEAGDPWTFNRVHSNAFTEHLEVEYLLMEDNSLVQDLPSDVFALNTKLDFVDLENMNLNHIDEDLFKNNDLLEKVYLHNNNIETIDEQVFNIAYNPVLSIVKLANNPIWRSEADNDLPQSQKDDLFEVARNIEFP